MAAPHPIKACLTHYDELFTAKCGEHPVITGREAKLMQGVVRQKGEQRTCELLDRFFSSQNEFILRAGYGLGVFVTQINNLISEPVRRRARVRL